MDGIEFIIAVTEIPRLQLATKTFPHLYVIPATFLSALNAVKAYCRRQVLMTTEPNVAAFPPDGAV